MPPEMKKRRSRRKRWRRWKDGQIHRGTYIVPNLFTTANLFSGFFGIVSAINGNFQYAGIAVLASCLFDVLDGKVARFTKATSRFGVEYDSLADLVAFGVGPGLLMYLWALKPFGRLGWLAAFVFVACGALRLARFNVQSETMSNKYFVGLSIPAGASMVATTVLFLHDWKPLFSPIANVPLLIMTYLLGLLMVSTIPYYSFKDMEFVRARPLPVLLGTILLLTVIALDPGIMLFALLMTYVASGPIIYLVLRYRRTPKEQAPEPIGPPKAELETPDVGSGQ